MIICIRGVTAHLRKRRHIDGGSFIISSLLLDFTRAASCRRYITWKNWLSFEKCTAPTACARLSRLCLIISEKAYARAMSRGASVTSVTAGLRWEADAGLFDIYTMLTTIPACKGLHRHSTYIYAPPPHFKMHNAPLLRHFTTSLYAPRICAQAAFHAWELI